MIIYYVLKLQSYKCCKSWWPRTCITVEAKISITVEAKKVIVAMVVIGILHLASLVVRQAMSERSGATCWWIIVYGSSLSTNESENFECIQTVNDEMVLQTDVSGSLVWGIYCWCAVRHMVTDCQVEPVMNLEFEIRYQRKRRKI